MAETDLTFAPIIQRADEPRHFMRIRSAEDRHVSILAGDQLLAESGRARRLIEFGKDVYDPVFYIPKEDVRVVLEDSETTTHCPLKGDTTYYHTQAIGEPLEDIAWEYTDPLDHAAELKGLVAFDPGRVTVIERPAKA